MKKTPFVLAALLLLFAGCEKKSETVDVIQFLVPPIEKITYTSSNSFYFGFAPSGSFNFGIDQQDQFKVLIEKVDDYNTPLITLNTFRYDQTNATLESLEFDRTQTSGDKIKLKFYYTNYLRLARIEEWQGSSLLTTFYITHEDNANGRKMTIAPYVVPNGASHDTLSHVLQVNSSGQVTKLYERRRSTGSSSGLSIDSFAIEGSYPNTSFKRGYQLYVNISQPRTDSFRTTWTYTRTANENPVLVDYLTMVYGEDFYNIIRYCDNLGFHELSNSVSSDFLVLHAQKKYSETQYQYSADVYTNGVFSHNQGTTRTRDNTFDAQNRLIKSKVYSTPPNFYTWEIIYK